MNESIRRQVIVLVAVDVAATCLALMVAWYLRFDLRLIPVTKGVPESAAYWRLLPLLAVLWPVV